MKIDLLEQLKRHEGYRDKAYQDTVDVWTVGYGKNLQELVITKEQAESWLREDVLESEIQLLAYFPIARTLSANRQKVLINMTYNMGVNRLKTFKKMWLAIENKDFNEACKQMKDSKWYVQVKSRADELIEQMKLG